MPSRQKSRQRALQILYLIDMRSEGDVSTAEAIRSYFLSLGDEEGEPVHEEDDFAEQLVKGSIENKREIDRIIVAHSQHWRIERMAVVDRNILRLASFEMLKLATPPPVVIDQALELAGKFSSPESLSFLNGVLDAIHHELFNGPPPVSPPRASEPPPAES
ncbi:MAG TPA: transcription antitermination factor NusB [Bryobacteraceae bacterium]|jgi:transcription antitermination protein NusB|nr:transcription antitermination factor NusB [Bryobacteraceae bacterium]